MNEFEDENENEEDLFVRGESIEQENSEDSSLRPKRTCEPY